MNKEICLTNEKISIIIPVYNIKNLLESTLKSVISQTYKNLEIILINDGSTDKSGDVCNFWAKQDSRIKYFYQKNQGVSSARNFGFSKSTGDFILFIDGDDEIASDMCEKLLSRLLSENADMSFCGFKNIFQDKTEQLIPQNLMLEKEEIIRALILDETFFTAVWNKLFKKTMLLDHEGTFISFEQGIHVGEDALWLSKVLKNAAKAAAVSEPLYFWKRRENSATQGGTFVRTDENYLSVLNAYRSIVLEVEDKNLKRSICKKYLGLSRDCLIQAYRNKEPDVRDRLLESISKDKNLYDKKDLFCIKLNLCQILVKLNISVDFIEKINKL